MRAWCFGDVGIDHRGELGELVGFECDQRRAGGGVELGVDARSIDIGAGADGQGGGFVGGRDGDGGDGCFDARGCSVEWVIDESGRFEGSEDFDEVFDLLGVGMDLDRGLDDPSGVGPGELDRCAHRLELDHSGCGGGDVEDSFRSPVFDGLGDEGVVDGLFDASEPPGGGDALVVAFFDADGGVSA